MTDIQTSLFPPRSVAEFVLDLQALTQEVQELYLQDQVPWVIGYSGGKDSTAILQLIWNAISSLPREQLHKTIHVITTDTLVENPIVAAWVRHSIERIKVAATEQNLPIEANLLYPDVKDRYWVNLIGKGYPAPRLKFRWCTSRLKINSCDQFIRNLTRACGEVIVIVGIRKAESANRAAIIAKRESIKIRDRISPRPGGDGSLFYTPIEDWRTDEVWLYLMQWENPWGHSNKDLFAMYRESTEENECPLVVDTSTPSCGSSRFGCWVCTVVEKEKSMEAMIQNNEERDWLQPLVDMRNELDIKGDREKRDFRRIYGKVELFERNIDGDISIEPIPGPYTKFWREHWLRRILEAERDIQKNAPPEMQGIVLITPEELSEIRRIWLDEKHEFEDSLPRIYKEVTGEDFIDSRVGAENSLLGNDEWSILTEICQSDNMHMELMSRLLDIERQYHVKSRRVGVYDKLDKCFDISSRSKEEAIENAHFKRDLKMASLDGNINSVKQLSWGSIKFKTEEPEE